jgi:hypothetical protein
MTAAKWPSVPSPRLIPVIARWLSQNGRTLRDLETASGISERTLRAILHGERETTTWRLTDRLLCAVDQVMLWHVPPDYGGFDDLWWPDGADADPLDDEAAAA